MVKIAGIQFTGTQDIKTNISILSNMIKTAIDTGAKLIVTPENSNVVSLDRNILWQQLHGIDTATFIAPFQKLAREYRVWIHLGSVVVPLDNKKCANRAFMINDMGDIVTTYDKIHMFDVVLSNTEQYKESDTVQAGSTIKVIDTPFGTYGFSICYDIRFPHLFTAMAQKGVDIIAIPAAFTDTTGKAHWDILTRARAIETGAFIIAVGHTGTHQDGRKTYGHSKIIHPWGNILDALEYETGVICADIDISEVQKTRTRIPNLQNMVKFNVK